MNKEESITIKCSPEALLTLLHAFKSASVYHLPNDELRQIVNCVEACYEAISAAIGKEQEQ